MRHRKFLSPVNIDSLNEKQTALKSFKKIEKGHNFSLTKDKMKGKNKIFKIRIKKAPGIGPKNMGRKFHQTETLEITHA